VGANGAHAFVLEVNVCRGVQGFFQAIGAHQWGRPVVAVNVPDFVWNLNESVGHVELLLAEF